MLFLSCVSECAIQSSEPFSLIDVMNRCEQGVGTVFILISDIAIQEHDLSKKM